MSPLPSTAVITIRFFFLLSAARGEQGACGTERQARWAPEPETEDSGKS